MGLVNAPTLPGDGAVPFWGWLFSYIPSVKCYLCAMYRNLYHEAASRKGYAGEFPPSDSRRA